MLFIDLQIYSSIFICARASASCNPSPHPNRGQLGRDKFKDCKSHCPRWRRAARPSLLGNRRRRKKNRRITRPCPPPLGTLTPLSPTTPRAFWNVRWPAWDASIHRAAQLTAQSAVTVHKSVVQQVHTFEQTECTYTFPTCKKEIIYPGLLPIDCFFGARLGNKE